MWFLEVKILLKIGSRGSSHGSQKGGTSCVCACMSAQRHLHVGVWGVGMYLNSVLCIKLKSDPFMSNGWSF